MKKQHLILIIGSLLSAQFALAMKITTVKGKKALIDLEGESAAAGDQYFALDGSGKKKAVLKIVQVKGGKAIAVVGKGSAQSGYTLQLGKAAGGGGEAGASYAGSSYSPASSGFRNWGVLGSYLMNNMTAKVGVDTVGEENVAMSGSGFGVLGFTDYALSRSFVLRASGGYEIYAVKGTGLNSKCTDSNDCNVNINYISMYGHAKYIFVESPNIWAGLGVGFLMAASKSSSVLNPSQISANQIYSLSLGTDISMGGKSFLPIAFDYNLFPASATVQANYMALRVGWAWNL